MVEKPTYEELERRVIELGREVLELTESENELRKSEELKREVESRYQTLFEHMPIVCFTFDREGRFLSWNLAAEEVYGYTKEEAIGFSAYDLIVTPATEEATKEVIKRVFEGEFVVGSEWQDRDKNGEVGWRMGNTFPLLRADGSVACGVNLNIDITDRKRAEEALQRQSEYLLALHETSLGLMNRLDMNELLEAILERAALLTGVEDGFMDLVDPLEERLELRFAIGYFRNLVGSRRKLKRGEGFVGTIWQTGKPLIVPDYSSWEGRLPGGAFDVLHNIIGVPLKSGSEVVGIIGLAHLQEGNTFGEEDVSVLTRFAELASIAMDNARLYEDVRRELAERKRAEEAFRQSEAQKKAILDASIDRIRLVDRDMRIIWANETTSRLLNVTPEECVGLRCHELFLGTETACPGCPTEKAMKSGQIEHSIMRQPFQKGISNESYWDDYAVPIKNESGKVVNVIQISRNITEQIRGEKERKALESRLRQAQKMEAVGTLAGGIAHDFNNILTPLIAHAEMALIDSAYDSPVRHNMQEVLRAGNRAKDLVKQILTFSRQGEERKIPLKITPIVRETLKLLRSSLPTTIVTRQNIGAESGVILADPTQIHQILMNLCTNAAHAMREKGGVLEVSLNDEYVDLDARVQYPDLKPGAYTRLTVSDTGHGMTPEVMQRIFDPFFTTKVPGEGTGMGLAVVHGIVESYRGTITANSEPGKGSTFEIFFSNVKTDVSPKTESIDQFLGGQERVLFVDDEKAIVDAMQRMLSHLGYRVTERTSSIEALEAFKADPERFDLVIADMTMPNMTGVDLARELLKTRRDIPVILCTGFSELIDQDKAKAIGIKAFLMKPVVMAKMAKIIREVLESKG